MEKEEKKTGTAVKVSVNLVKAAADRLHETVPFIYDQIAELLSRNVISLDEREKKKIEEDKTLDTFLDILSKNLKRQLPSYVEIEHDETGTRGLVRRFVDTLTKNKFRKKELAVFQGKAKFRRMAIAATGQGSLRIVRACKELGIQTLLFYSKEDKDDFTLKLADKAIKLKKNKFTGLFDIEDIVDSAKKNKADALHPGYGPLASSIRLSQLCEYKNIAFIGPSPETTKLLRNKILSKTIAESQRILVVPGSRKIITTKEELGEFVTLLGFPVILKPVKGDLGIGIKEVWKEEDLDVVFKEAAAETAEKLNSRQFYVEKFLPKVKAVELIVLADTYKNVVVLGTLDSTLTYGFSKLVQESPSPFIDPKMYEEMKNAVIDIVKAIDFQGVGSVEFLIPEDKKPYFLEMNPWVELDHELIEFLHSVDLVREQINIRAGSKLSFSQKEIEEKVQAAVIECKITNEDPFDDFKLTSGVLKKYAAPGGPAVLVSSDAAEGKKYTNERKVTIARLICKADKREDAIKTLKRALEEFRIEGIKTTLPLFLNIVENKNFLTLDYSSDFFEENRAIFKK